MRIRRLSSTTAMVAMWESSHQARRFSSSIPARPQLDPALSLRVSRLGPAFGAEVLAPVKEGAVGHGPVTANVAGLIPVQRIDGDDIELQIVSAFEHLYLLGDAVGNEIKNSGLAEILGEGPV